MTKMIKKRTRILKIILFFLILISFSKINQSKEPAPPKRSPRIVNIINFIRQCEPRIDWVTEDVLYQTVVEQIKIINRYHLKATFLLQYDALIDPRYQKFWS